ncbi:MAG TPA: metalloregulator ArsR/SmtB family transcription factor [Nocardioidaceae bacterium]|nr:metalloregulator ArsR/SmtB family transcription factor [Nocardioidaceae bacterium]
MSLEVSALRALAHPLRLQMLSLLTSAALSAAEIARELDVTQANASYHLRTLLQAGLITEVGEERIRGGVAKRYRHDIDAPPVAARPERLGIYAQALAAEMVRRSDLRLEGPTEGRTEGRTTSTDAELWVEPEVWTDVVDRVAAAMHDLHESARRPRTPGTIRTSATAMLFEMDSGR